MKVHIAGEYAGPALPRRSQDETVSEAGHGKSSGRGVPPEFGRRLGGGYRELSIDRYDLGGFPDRSQLLLDDALSETIPQATVSDLGENDGRREARIGGFDPVLRFAAEAGSADQLDPGEGVNREIQSDLPR